jgi:hypothetical protein
MGGQVVSGLGDASFPFFEFGHGKYQLGMGAEGKDQS